MCQEHQQSNVSAQGGTPGPPPDNGPFPWHIPVFDAHCHPTDTMSSIASFHNMRASALTIMATRSHDQDLVADVASTHGIKEQACLRNHGHKPHRDHDASSALPDAQQHCCQVVPSFGWHPWFSHQLYDDGASEPTFKPPPQENDDGALLAAKKAHYQAVLAPSPQDDDFIRSLPTPMPLSSFINSTRSRLGSYPIALVGEIGLDKAFRLPQKWDPSEEASRDSGLTPGGREGRLLSPHRVRMQHQQTIMLAQARLAGELCRPVSLHGVQAHGVLYDAVSALWKGHEKHVPSRREKRMMAPGAEDSDSDADEHDGTAGRGKPFPPRICLHSYSGSVEALKQWLHPTAPSKVYISFSTAINLGTEASRDKFADVVRAVPDGHILVETDLHTAGEDMDAALEDMYRRVCDVKGWGLEEGVRRIGRNFEEFIFGR